MAAYPRREDFVAYLERYGLPDLHQRADQHPIEPGDGLIGHADAAVGGPPGIRYGSLVPWMPITPPPGQSLSTEYPAVPNACGP